MAQRRCDGLSGGTMFLDCLEAEKTWSRPAGASYLACNFRKRTVTPPAILNAIAQSQHLMRLAMPYAYQNAPGAHALVALDRYFRVLLVDNLFQGSAGGEIDSA